MKHDYQCIRSRIKEDPQWFDEHGVGEGSQRPEFRLGQERRVRWEGAS